MSCDPFEKIISKTCPYRHYIGQRFNRLEVEEQAHVRKLVREGKLVMVRDQPDKYTYVREAKP